MQTIKKKTWLLTNSEIRWNNELTSLVVGNVRLYAEKGAVKTFNTKKGEIHILIDGYLMPRLEFFQQYSNIDAYELVKDLFEKDDKNISSYIKGNFNLVIIKQTGFTLINDHLGIKKYFLKADGANFLFSSDLRLISKNINNQLDHNHIAINSLMHHYIDDHTFIKDISQSQPAAIVSLINSNLVFDSYWHLQELIDKKKEKVSFDEFASFYISLISAYLKFFKVKKSLLSLTGGMDSRTLLAGLLHLGHQPDTFTFGNPESGDVLVAKKLAEEFGLVHRNPNQSNPTAKWFEGLSDIVLEKGNSLTNFHRSYRLEAMIQEANATEDYDITFGGFLGGEPIRGIFLDNYIITPFAQKFAFENTDYSTLLNDILAQNYIPIKNVDKDVIFNKIKKQPYFGDIQKRHKEFYMIFKIIGETHLTQDINLYNNYHNMLVSPYMDIDYIDLLFSSNQCMLFKDNTSENQFKRINNPLLHSKILQKIYPQLTHQMLNNNYTPKEYLTSKLYYLGIRAYRKKFWPKRPPNFSYGDWYKEFFDKKFNNLNQDSVFGVFDLEKASQGLNAVNQNNLRKEGTLHKYTNILMLNDFIKYYF